ncbi:MAG: beta-lactamase family protein, partial [Gammaproteobacteria bacterium]|nr:beta-lactamase family protein [Gammaproteobacteria bacterium]
MARPTAADLGLNLSADAQQRVDWSNWTLPPYNRWAFQHVQELTRTTRVSRSPQLTELVYESQELGSLEFTSVTGDISSVEDMLDDTWTDGFLVMHRGKVITEQYFNDMQPDTLHLLMSCSKSLTTAAVGIAVEEGSLELARNITDYLPELDGSGFSGATI